MCKPAVWITYTLSFFLPNAFHGWIHPITIKRTEGINCHCLNQHLLHLLCISRYILLCVSALSSGSLIFNGSISGASTGCKHLSKRVAGCKQWHTEGGVCGVQPPPPKFWRPSKSCQTQPDLWKLLEIAEFRTPTPQDLRKKGSKILKLPRLAIVLH